MKIFILLPVIENNLRLQDGSSKRARDSTKSAIYQDHIFPLNIILTLERVMLFVPMLISLQECFHIAALRILGVKSLKIVCVRVFHDAHISSIQFLVYFNKFEYPN